MRSIGRVALQVGLDLQHRAQLVGRLLVRERGLHLGLPGRVVAEGMAVRRGTRRVQLQELLRQVRDRLAHPGPGPLPLPAAEARQLRLLAARVAGDALDLLHGHPDLVRAREVQLQEVTLLGAIATGRSPDQPGVARHAVVDVDHHVPGREPLQDVPRHDPPERPRPTHADRAEQLPVGDQDDAVRAAGEAAVEAPVDERQATRRRRVRQRGWWALARMSASASSSASRADWSDASTTRAPSARQRATVAAMDPMGTGGRDGSCQPNGLPPGGAPSASLSQVSSQRPRRRPCVAATRAGSG